jgi:hypothetical protein
MRRLICVTYCILSLTVPLFSQSRRSEPLTQTAISPPYRHPVVVTRPYQQTWYGALLRQFNPDNRDWGQWLEERRQAFLEQTAANPYFKYSLMTTLLLVMLTMALTKALIDKSRTKWLAEERHEDLLQHDRHSRQAAREAIRKYNTHMEKCNRVVEAEAGGRSTIASAPAPTQGAMTLDQALAQNAQLKRERDLKDAELNGTKAMVGELTMRLNSMSGGGDGPPQAGPAQGELMKQFNDLREQLYRERERNKQLKGM